MHEVFTHCPGIGPKTEQRLRNLGVCTWDDCLRSESLPFRGERRDRIIAFLRDSLDARARKDIGWFVSRFPAREHWRILREFLSVATFFDIETTGLYWYESHATVITAYHRGELHTFVHGKNLDEFLDLIDEAELLVSFNGSCFDIPFIEHTFHIPSVDRPHIDLRWVAYHAGYRGGLKYIEKMLDVRRPKEIAEIDGFEAVNLFYRWQAGDDESLAKLIRYCSADVVSTYLVAQRLVHPEGKKVLPGDHDRLFAMAMDSA